ncbi:MAG: SurA N-terminal domain-containing protein [Planctomycetota bacterium]|jgi:hypothetical protein|nr:SurA N-terminal domain-containing protein [Planctomycetota bacterium]
MDMFRRNQKWVFIIVSIIIIPSFALVWGVGGFQAHQNVEIAKIGRESLNYRDYERFRLRMRAAMGEMPFYFNGAPDTAATGDLWAHIWAYSVIKDAEAAGVKASDAIVGTYLQNAHPITSTAYRNDPSSLEGEVTKICRRLQISRAEFLAGVRDLMTLNSYVNVDNNTVAVTEDSAYRIYALEKAQALFKRIRTPESAGMSEQAKAEFTAKDPEELQTLVRDYILARRDDDRFRDAATWRFSYVLLPYATETAPHVFSEDEIRSFYDQNRAMFANLPFENVRDIVVEALSANERERTALRNLTIDVDPQLRANGEMSPEELAKLTQLAKYGVKAGTTGESARSAARLAADPLFGPGSEITAALDEIDGMADEERATTIESWKNGFNLAMRPVKGAEGYLRLKLLDYTPSRPADIDAGDGAVRSDLYEAALSDLVGERVAELALDKAEETASGVRDFIAAAAAGGFPEGEFADMYRAIPEETLPYSRMMGGTDYEFGKLAVGEVYGPVEYADAASGEKGWELRVLTGRAIPTRDEFDGEAADVKARYQGIIRMDRSGDSGRIDSFVGPVFRIQPTDAMFLTFWDRVGKGEIRVNPDIVGS